MNHRYAKALFVFLIFLLFSCTTPPEKKEPAPPTPSAPTIAETPKPVQPEPQPVVEKPVPPPVVPEPPAAEQPAPPAVKEDILTDKIEDASLSITSEKYQKTFEEVEKVIEELNSIIRAGDFNSWKNYLTVQFIDSVMDSENLRQLNEQPLLQRNKIVIKTLGDYFTYVVVPSRASVRLDDLIFTTEKRVRAFMLIRKDRVLIYQLENIDSKWKISTW